MQNILKDIPENIKIIISSSAPFIIVLVLFFVVGNFAVSKVSGLRDQIDQATVNQNILSQKLNILESVSTTLGSAPNLATTALPSTNTSLTEISQLKNLAATDSVSLSNIKSGSEIKNSAGVSEVDTTLDVTGSENQIIKFIQGTTTIAPITVLGSVKLNESGGASKASMTVESFWSALPATLPPVSQSLSDLTLTERNTVASISALIQPQFLVLPATSGGKTDPFSP